ncbi:hypothetical protein CLOSTASPAR_00532, partial [[Clostridium] asparagiforme DSM 15981]
YVSLIISHEEKITRDISRYQYLYLIKKRNNPNLYKWENTLYN